MRPGPTRPLDRTRWNEAGQQEPPKNAEDVRLRLDFSYTPWKDVLEWLATQAGLSVVGDNLPSGTCNYRDTQSYTVSQTIDVLNSILSTRGFILLCKERMLVVWDLEDGAIPSDIPILVNPEELSQHGEYELMTCIFALSKVTPEEIESDIRKLLGPAGSVQVLPKARRIAVTDSGARLRTIANILQSRRRRDRDEFAESGDSGPRLRICPLWGFLFRCSCDRIRLPQSAAMNVHGLSPSGVTGLVFSLVRRIGARVSRRPPSDPSRWDFAASDL